MRFLASLLAAGAALAMPALQGRDGAILPSQDSFYFPTGDLSAYAPGTILKDRPPPAPIAALGVMPANLQAERQLLYRTSDNHGNATATVVTVLVPYNADMGKVLSYQIAIDAVSIDCAPSYVLQQDSKRGPLVGSLLSQAEFLLIQAALEEGWVVVVPDFQGPQASYLANKLAGHATLDGIRAALGSGAITGIKADATVTMWGYSGGSLASQWAAELQPAYAPELKIAGAAIGGTVPNITNVIKSINERPLAGFIAPGVLGLVSAYPSAAPVLDAALKPDAKASFYAPLKQCLIANAAEFLGRDVLGMFKDRNFLYTNPQFKLISDDNSLGQATPTIPLFWYKSILDEVSPIGDSDSLEKKYCAAGATVEYTRDLLSNHGGYAVEGAPLAFSWLKKVMNGEDGAVKDGCSTKTDVTGYLDKAQFEVIPQLIGSALLHLLGKKIGPVA